MNKYTMKSNKLLDQWRVCVLGAINGLLFGGIAEQLRHLYNEYEYQRLVNFSNGVPSSMADPLRWWMVPCFFGLVFTVTSLLVHKYWVNRPNSLILLWQKIGLTAVGACVLTMMIYGWLNNLPFTSSIRWTWLASLALVVITNLAYGAVLQLGTMQYSQGKDKAID